MKRAVILLFAFLSFVACAGPNEFTVTKNSPEFTFRQPANPTTGYTWLVKSYDSELIEVVSSNYEKPDSNQQVGAAGQQIWVFKATPKAFEKATTTQIELSYIRPWSPGDNPKLVAITVNTKP